MVIQRENSCCWKPSQKNRAPLSRPGIVVGGRFLHEAHESEGHRTPIMPGGLISNRDEGHFRLSACAVRIVSAPTAVCSHLDESQGHSITKRRVPNKGTSATRAVAWGSVGRLIDPQISNSTKTTKNGCTSRSQFFWVYMIKISTVLLVGAL